MPMQCSPVASGGVDPGVKGLGTDPHPGVIGVVQADSVRNLFRRPVASQLLLDVRDEMLVFLPLVMARLFSSKFRTSLRRWSTVTAQRTVSENLSGDRCVAPVKASANL